MDKFDVTFLGTGSAKPCSRRNPACTVVNYRENLFMIDCGEGAQRSMQQKRMKFSRLGHIFLTHLHGDHVLGLPGLVSTLSLSGKEGEINIHTFEEGAEILSKIFDFFAADLKVNVKFNILDPYKEEIAFENNSLIVRTIPLNHRVPCVGYVFEEKPKLRHLRRDMIDFHNIPIALLHDIKNGADFVTPEGIIIKNEILTTPADHSRIYAHISDTKYMNSLHEKIKGADLLFHETTYLDDLSAEAKKRYHSTALQAATVARDAGAKRLVMGHYSSRYRETDDFVKEAQTVFPDCVAAYDGITLSI